MALSPVLLPACVTSHSPIPAGDYQVNVKSNSWNFFLKSATIFFSSSMDNLQFLQSTLSGISRMDELASTSLHVISRITKKQNYGLTLAKAT